MKLSDMDRWLDEEIRKAGQVGARSRDPEKITAAAARMVALAQIRARVWKVRARRAG